MDVLIIGGTGIISSAAVDEALRAGHEVWTLTRGRSALENHVGARALVADAADETRVRTVLAGRRFDVVVQFTAYDPAQIDLDLRLYADAGQYVFISSASAYRKPPTHWLTTESTPLENPHWQYSRDKIACEAMLLAAHRSTGFPVTIVRPSLTYGYSQVPVSMGSWSHPFTIIDRMRRGAPIIIPGDGTSLWTITHNTDFARGLLGLFAHPDARGEAVHITSDEVLTWNQIYQLVADAADVEIDVVHVPSEGIIAADPELEGTLWGDKAHSAVFDNAKLRSMVPGFAATVPFASGIRETVAWFDADPRRQSIDHAANDLWDRIAEVYLDARRRVART